MLCQNCRFFELDAEYGPSCQLMHRPLWDDYDGYCKWGEGEDGVATVAIDVPLSERATSGRKQAVKVLEEAAEVFSARDALFDYLDSYDPDAETVRGKTGRLAEEIGDLIIAACGLADRCGIDVQGALDFCGGKNAVREASE